MASQDAGELPADGLRDLGQNPTELGADLLARAAEVDDRTIGRVIIDTLPKTEAQPPIPQLSDSQAGSTAYWRI
jgi:hypothetical protein